jgi:hypothetical protein
MNARSFSAALLQEQPRQLSFEIVAKEYCAAKR